MPVLCKLLFTFILIVFLNSFSFAQALPELEKVKEIKLLENTRDDVRRILASYKFIPTEKQNYEDNFETENAKIHVSYSEGKCEFWEKLSFDWNVSEWKVVGIKIMPKNRLNLNELGLDLTKFKQENYYKHQKEPIYYHRKDIGLVIMVIRDKVWVIDLVPPKSSYISMCDKKLAKRLLSTSCYFDPQDKNREKIDLPNDPPKILDLILSHNEINSTCSHGFEANFCSDSLKTITVFTYAKDPENDSLTYAYEISGGKIVGNGAKILWDLSGVKVGTYTITVAVDDGGGFTEKNISKPVVVKECSDCKKP